MVIGHPYLGRAGSEARVMWLIEALKHECDVTLVTTGGWDLADLNYCYGTRVAEDEVKIRIAPTAAIAHLLEAAALRDAYYQRFARSIAAEYDFRISAYNLTDWGLPGIHFLADFSWDANLRELLNPPSPGLFYRDTFLRRAYLRLARHIKGTSKRDALLQDAIVANSAWSAETVKRHFNITCAACVYPPVSMEFPDIPWAEKQLAFVMIGRIAPEKRVERAIRILETVRRRGYTIKFHLCGRFESDLYGRHIARLCRQNENWVIREGFVHGDRKATLLASCRFGIQTRDAEPFGISAAEMIKAGAIVFAPQCGGQAEIVDSGALLFDNADDAVEKICTVLQSSEMQLKLRNHLALRSESFSAQRFTKEVYEVVLRRPSVAPLAVRRRLRPRVVIGHPRLGLGGSESVVMWLIDALHRECDVTVLTTGGWDLSTLNSQYGTRIEPDGARVRLAPIPAAIRGLSAAALRGAYYQRFAREVASQYDLRISAYNLTDWGLPGIHFIADFSWHPQLRMQLDPRAPGLFYRKTVARKLYLALAQALQRPSGRDVLHEDKIIANSHWSAALIKEQCGVTCAAVVYPPVWENFREVEWEEREPSFVMIGRIAPEKRIEYGIEILDAVRLRGHRVRLRLCGKFEGDTYGNFIATLCERRKDWIVREGYVTGFAKQHILASCQYGLQARAAEPFGISVAEMIKAGAIVFAPAGGGQTEILSTNDLLFRDLNEAVDKVSAVLSSATRQEALRSLLARQSRLFSVAQFKRETMAVIGPQIGLTADPAEVDNRASTVCTGAD